MPVMALLLASGISVALVIARIAWTGKLGYAFLAWNLLLAWLPLVFALLACDAYHKKSGRNWRFIGLGAAWLIFFPNAPYIFTDVIHLTTKYYFHFWIDLVLILTCAVTGLVLGFVSLYLMQSVVMRMVGRWASWFFIAAVAALSGFGIYLGRFLRLNSWDVVLSPLKLCRGIGHWALNPLSPSTSYAFPALFATFLFVTYLMLYALTQLKPALTTSPQPAEP